MRGNASPASDAMKVSYDDMLGFYSGQKFNGLGAYIRFAQSSFAMIAIITCVSMFILAEVQKTS